MKIHKLSDHVINQIAAGEVVERPASVVKELVENSLDAGATEITVNLEEGGLELIEVIDNGRGIEKADFALVFERHATSKINSLEDLEAVVTMGFRGEALASIASVARVAIVSAAVGSQVAYKIEQNGINVSDIEAVSRGQGTTVSVYNLFSNVPARHKYLKKAQTEFQHVLKTVAQLAACYPEVRIELKNNRETKLLYPAQDLAARSLQLLGLQTPDQLFPVSYTAQDLQITGYIAQPQHAAKQRQKQFVVVNQRALSVPFVDKAIKEALRTIIPHDHYPLYVLHLELTPQAVDMNVHPRKLEARFAYQQFVYQKVLAAVKAAADKHVLSAKLEFGSAANFSRPYPVTSLSPSSYVSEPRQQRAFAVPNRPTVNQSLAFNQAFSGEVSKVEAAEEVSSLKAIAQLDEAYILAVEGKNLVIVDQHAAHERIMYARLHELRAQRTDLSTAQHLLTPIELNLTAFEATALADFIENLKELGFNLHLENCVLTVQTLPSCFIQKDDTVAVIKGLVADLAENHDDLMRLTDLQSRIERVINYTACRSAIKFGQALSLNEQQGLLDQLVAAEINYSCPHGRPTRIEISLTDLEKQFGR